MCESHGGFTHAQSFYYSQTVMPTTVKRVLKDKSGAVASISIGFTSLITLETFTTNIGIKKYQVSGP